MRYKSTFMLAVLVMCGAFTVAHADVKYTRVTKITTPPKNPSQPSSVDTVTRTLFVAKDKSRSEYKDGKTDDEISITRCDLNQSFVIDNNLEIYAVSPMNKDGIHKSLVTNAPVSKDIPEDKMIINFSVQKLATEKINGFETQCYSVVIQEQGNRSKSKPKSKMKIWVADVPGWQACNSEKSLYTSSSEVIKTPKGDRRFTMEYTGDVDLMKKISAEFSVRREGSVDIGLVTDTLDIVANVTSFAQVKKLDDSLFEVPAGYRKVSEKEFYKLQSQAKKKAIAESKNSKAQQ